MDRLLFLIPALSASLISAAAADEVRQTSFPSAMIGTWAEQADQCGKDDKSNVVIAANKYGDGSGSCDVKWIVQTAAARGTNYAVHAICTSASEKSKTQTVNIIVRPSGDGNAIMGRSFDTLKVYQRCPAK
jgi:hypothetical protein